jgi:hypothetical protein
MQLTLQQRQKIKIVKDDYYLYCEKNLYIQDKAGLLVKFTPNSIQKKIIDYVLECLVTNVPIRLIILKARQEGVSTVVESIIYWYTATHKNVSSKIVSHDRESAYNLYSMFQRYYENSHSFFKPSTKYKTKNDLLFDNELGTGLKSQISISSAENTGTGRGLTIHWLHASEVAMWTNGAEILAGLLQTVPMLPNTAIFLESTANGVGDFFYNTWQAAREGRSVFKPFFFGWHEHTDYQLPTEPLTDLTEEEQSLKITYELTDQQIAWRRVKVREFAGNEEKFAQEYPINEAEAFLASGRPRFNIPKLMEMEKSCYNPGEFELVEKRPDKGFALTKGLTAITPIKVPGAPLKIWERPQEGVKYVIGADVSDVGEDNSVATIMRTDKNMTVARWCGDIEPSEFGEELFQLGEWYNNALVGVESNNHGLTVIQRLRDMRYKNLYRREKGIDERFETATSKLGWRTDRKTKPLMIDTLSEIITKGNIIDYDLDFVRECVTYVVNNKGQTNAQEGKHDDRVIATAIALQLFEAGDIVYRRKARASYPNKYLQAKRNNRSLHRGKAKAR